MCLMCSSSPTLTPLRPRQICTSKEISVRFTQVPKHFTSQRCFFTRECLLFVPRTNHSPRWPRWRPRRLRHRNSASAWPMAHSGTIFRLGAPGVARGRRQSCSGRGSICFGWGEFGLFLFLEHGPGVMDQKHERCMIVTEMYCMMYCMCRILNIMYYIPAERPPTCLLW